MRRRRWEAGWEPSTVRGSMSLTGNTGRVDDGTRKNTDKHGKNKTAGHSRYSCSRPRTGGLRPTVFGRAARESGGRFAPEKITEKHGKNKTAGHSRHSCFHPRTGGLRPTVFGRAARESDRGFALDRKPGRRRFPAQPGQRRCCAQRKPVRGRERLCRPAFRNCYPCLSVFIRVQKTFTASIFHLKSRFLSQVR